LKKKKKKKKKIGKRSCWFQWMITLECNGPYDSLFTLLSVCLSDCMSHLSFWTFLSF
jgi:hypothetical protein